MFPLKAAFTPKDSSRWFAFNSRLQGATPSSRPGLSLVWNGTGWHWVQDWSRTCIRRGPRPCTTYTPFPLQTGKAPHPLAEPTTPQPVPPFPRPLLGKSLRQRGPGSPPPLPPPQTVLIAQGRRKGQRSRWRNGSQRGQRAGRCERFEKPNSCFSITRFRKMKLKCEKWK